MAAIDETEIKNIEVYNQRMSKSFVDKIFFMDKISEDIHIILDYGCADGTLICELGRMYPDMVFLGYDISEEMIELAIKKMMAMHLTNVHFFTSRERVKEWIREESIYGFDAVALNMSSLIHEIYSYCNEKEIEDFWHFVVDTGFGCIITRDMCLNRQAHRPALERDITAVYAHYPIEKIEEFERCHGAITDNFNLIHFLMKYRYTENWDREVKENYLPVTPADIIHNVERHYDYKCIYSEHYILPFLARKVEEDFGIVIKDPTHIKFIFERTKK